jgi:ornithine carbamoyltransferase
MKHVLSLEDLSSEEVHHVVRLAVELKREPDRFRGLLRDRWLLMLFQKTSTRTRMSFEMGIKQLGGEAVVMDWDSSNFAISPIRFEARYVSRHMDLVMARLKEHEDTQTLAEFSGVPVINGCDNKFHPCQALADLVTVYETAGSFEGQTLTYAGIHNNVANSLLIACTHVGMNLILVTPEKNAASDDAELMRRMMSKGNVERTLQFNDAAKRSQFVYTDTWVDMEFFEDESFSEEKDRRVEKMLPFQLNAENLAGSEAFILHDMPIHPGYEISAELIESPRSRIYQQAENRLYAQQALMLLLLGAGG